MLLMERIPGQTGYLVLTNDGAVIESGGDLSNDERAAGIITALISTANRIDANELENSEFQKIAITYDNHSYVICLSNKKIHVVKKGRNATAATTPAQITNGIKPAEPSLINV